MYPYLRREVAKAFLLDQQRPRPWAKLGPPIDPSRSSRTFKNLNLWTSVALAVRCVEIKWAQDALGCMKSFHVISSFQLWRQQQLKHLRAPDRELTDQHPRSRQNQTKINSIFTSSLLACIANWYLLKLRLADPYASFECWPLAGMSSKTMHIDTALYWFEIQCYAELDGKDVLRHLGCMLLLRWSHFALPWILWFSEPGQCQQPARKLSGCLETSIFSMPPDLCTLQVFQEFQNHLEIFRAWRAPMFLNSLVFRGDIAAKTNQGGSPAQGVPPWKPAQATRRGMFDLASFAQFNCSLIRMTSEIRENMRKYHNKHCNKHWYFLFIYIYIQ